MSEIKYRIAYIVPMGAGLDAFVYREIEALNELSNRVILFATKYKKGDVLGPKKEWLLRTLTPLQLLIRMPFIIIRLLFNLSIFIEAIKDKAVIDFIFALDYSAAMKRYKVKQIHCHHGDHKLFIGYFCKRLTGLPLSVTIHAAEFYTNPNPELFSKVIKCCDKVFPISQRWFDKLHLEYGVQIEKIQLNRLFVDSQLYKPYDPIKVISVGRYTDRKGFQYLLEAAKQLRDLNIHFIFVGFGNLDLKSIAIEFNVSNQVTVFNKMDQKQLRLMFQSADILCVPSITTKEEGAEGIPVVLMEGMACGLAVVATKCGAIDEIVNEEYLVEERSPELLAFAIRKLAENEQLRIDQGIKNREIVLTGYSVNNVKSYIDGLESLV
jgi:glycosyltransferase involved in cell wall biosynthesis